MAQDNTGQFFTDDVWAVWEPLVEAARPKGKTKPLDLRRTLEAVVWRLNNGAKWRSVPPALGPWWRAAQLFIRWSKAGVWERLLDLTQAKGVSLGMAYLDGTNIRAHQKAAGAQKRGSAARNETNARLWAGLVAATAQRLASSRTATAAP